MRVETVIIGSGISGLSLAHFMSKKDKSFIVIEAESKVGGIIQTKKNRDFICEFGPNTVLLNNEAIIELIKDCDLWDELIYPSKKSDKNRYVIHNGKLVAVPTSIGSFLFSPILSVRAKLRLFFEPFIPKSAKNLSVYDFIKNRFGKEFHDKLIEPFLTGIYAGNTKKMSAKHVLKKLWTLEQDYGSVLNGFFRRKSSKVKSLPTSFSFPNGLAQLTSSIEKNIKENVIFNTTVKNVEKDGDEYIVRCNSQNFTCKNVISTIPSYALKEIITKKGLKDELESIIYSPITVFHFAFQKKNIRNSLEGFGVLTKPSDKKNFLGVLFNTQIFNHVSPEDKELFTVLVGGERQRELCDLDIDDLQEKVLADLEDLIDHSGDLMLNECYKWNYGIPQYGMRQDMLSQEIYSFEKENKGFYILGNFFNGVSVSDCVMNAKKLSDLI